ncbi:MAG: matrixin family metalloprotease [Acidobacteriota bacterium]|nr:matrixin family metalloprotease [Acidobacteriota bacterium]
MRRPKPILALLAMLACGVSSQPSSFEPRGSSDVQIKWARKTIQIALSTSLTFPSASIMEGSDVEGAVKRALESWANAANIKFVVVSSKGQSVSPANQADGTNLITVAPTNENLAMFGDENNAARTRVFYDPATGEINEADIVLNPFPYSGEGVPLQFSTDGTPGTYDLESTLAHEIGHLLGLNHSSVIAATMQASQGLNGIYGLPASSERSLSEADRVAVRSLYGPCENLGAVKGRISNSSQSSLPVAGGHVWLEDLATGRVIADSLTRSNGSFNIRCVPAGDYRVMAESVDESFVITSVGDKLIGPRGFRSIEISSSLRVTAEKTTAMNYVFVSPQNSPRALVPRLLGMNGDLSTVPVSAKAGATITLYIAGQGVDQVPGNGFVITSPFITVDAASLTLQQTHRALPVISFEVTIGANAPPGDYTVRLQLNSGETAYLAGAITIEPGF